MPALLFGVALTVRLLYALEYRSSPFFSFPIVDAATYDRMARELARGAPLWEGAFWQPPLYPFLLGLYYKVIGHDPMAVRVAQGFLGAATCVLTYALARRVHDERAGRVAALIVAGYGPLIYFDGELLPATLVVPLVLLTVLVLLLVAESPRERRWKWLGAGIVLGVAAVARPNILLFLPVAAMWLFWVSVQAGWRRAVVCCSLLVLGAGLPVGVVTARNFLAADDFVLVSYNGGINFYIGNNERARETVAIRPGFAWEQLVREPKRAGVGKASASSRYFLAKGLGFLREQPTDAATLYAEKASRLVSAFEIGRNQDVYGTRRDSMLLSGLLWRAGPLGFPFGLLFPLAVAGMWATRSRRPSSVLPYLAMATYAVSVLLFFVSARYRLPLVPFLAVFAGAYVSWLCRRPPRRAVLISVAIAIGAAVLANRDFSPLDRLYVAERDRYLGYFHTEQGLLDEAEAAYERAIERDPSYVEAHAELGQIFEERGRLEEAVAAFERCVALMPESEQTQLLLGRTLSAHGDLERGEEHLARSLAIEENALAHREMGVLHLERGDTSAAERHLLASAELDAADVDTWYKLGQCYVLMQRYTSAREALEEALRLLPGDREILEKISSLRTIERAIATQPHRSGAVAP